MGVSLQVYRSRIGTFQSSKVQSNKSTSTTQSDSLHLGKWLSLLVLLSALVTLQLSIDPVHHKPGSQHLPHLLQPSGSYHTVTRSQLQDTPCRLTSKDRNVYAKMVNGNRGAGIKLLHWNKGASHLHNKHHDIETIIAGHHPHVLGLSEANLRKDHDLSLVQHENYDLHTSPTAENPELATSRIVVYTLKSLVVKHRNDLEDNRVSAIWMEVGLPHKKKIIICQGYREWKYLGQPDASSGTVAAQFQRWSILLTMWEKALLEGKEVIVMMDANIDFFKWTRDDLPPTDSTSKLKSLISHLFNTIFPHGVSQLVTVPTRAWPGQTESGLDHIYTNKPDKLSSVYAEFAGGSDHKLIKVTRYTKSMKRAVRYVRKRSFKNFKDEDFQAAVKNLSWWELYMCEDADQAAQLLTNKLTDILDTMAPVRTIQVRSKYVPWLSDSTKEVLKERNNAQATAAQSQNLDDWRLYKSLRNSATARMRQEKKAWEKMKLDSSKHDPSTLWKSVKTWLNWNNSGPPSQLFHLGRLINSPAGLAGAMNSFFIEKVSRLRQNIPGTDDDPLAKLKESLKDRQCSLTLKAVKPDDVLKVIRSLKNSKSTGTDNIDTWVIKLVASDILPALTPSSTCLYSNPPSPTCGSTPRLFHS